MSRTPPILEHLEALPKARQVRPGAWVACCPAHEDTTPSLPWSTSGDKVLVKCQAGCETEAVVAALGMKMSDLFAPKTSMINGASPASSPAATLHYDYRDEDGHLLFQVERRHGKAFRQRRPDGRGGWVYNLDGVRRVLYRLPELLAADPSETVYVVEGERDADNLARLGLVATTNPAGANKWRDDYSESLRGRDVVVFPDNDAPGQKHAEHVARALQGIASTVRVVLLPGLSHKGDVSDYLADGGTVEELRVIVRDWPRPRRRSRSPVASWSWPASSPSACPGHGRATSRPAR